MTLNCNSAKILKNFVNIIPNLVSINSLHTVGGSIDQNNATDNRNGNEKKPKIIIVGAGVAGLSAANHLLHNHFDNIEILEASNRYGGRIQTMDFGDATCELGAKWIYRNNLNKSFYELIKNDKEIEKFLDFTEKYFVTSKGEKLNPLTVQKVSEAFHEILKNAHYLRSGGGSFLHNTKLYLEMLTEKISKNLFKKNSQEASQIFNTLIKDLASFFGCDLSTVHVCQLSRISQFYKNLITIQTGLMTVLKPVVNQIQMERLQFGKPVERINWSIIDPKQNVKIVCLDNTSYMADHVICTIPLGTMKMFSKTLFNPSLPNEKLMALKSLGVSTPGQFYLNYTDKVNGWFFGNIKPTWTSEELGNRNNMCQDITEISSVSRSEHVLEIKRIGDEDFERLSEINVIENSTKLLRNLMQNPNIPYPSDMIRSNWGTDTNYLGGLPYLTKPNSETYIDYMSDPVGPTDLQHNQVQPKLLFAGDATDWDGFGTLDGARRSGIREAQRLIDYYNSGSHVNSDY